MHGYWVCMYVWLGGVLVYTDDGREDNGTKDMVHGYSVTMTMQKW